MSDAPLSFPERAALFALMTFVDEVANPDVRARYGFAIDGKVRTRLRDDGYLGDDDRKNRRPGRPFVLHLEEKGWRWCRDELRVPPSAEIPKAYRLLYGLLNSIDLYLRRSGRTMDEFFGIGGTSAEGADAARTVPKSPVTDVEAVEKQIRLAYHELVLEPRGWIGLRALRERLGGLPRADVDAALLRLDLLPGVYLQPESDQKTLTEADRAAAIRIGGEAKHLLSIEGV
jgi:hypothetical protein